MYCCDCVMCMRRSSIVTTTVDAVYLCFFFSRRFLCVCVCEGKSARRITNVYNFADLCQCLLTLSIEQFSRWEAIVFPIPIAFKWTPAQVIYTTCKQRAREKEKNVKLHGGYNWIYRHLYNGFHLIDFHSFCPLEHSTNRCISTTMSAKFNWISADLSNLILSTT